MDEYKCKCDKRQRPYQSTLELTCKWMDLFVQLRGLHGTISITQRGERIVATAGHATVPTVHDKIDNMPAPPHSYVGILKP